MKPISAIINDIIKLEGGYVNHPDDRGGPTRYGITKDTAENYGYYGDIKNLPEIIAKNIYIEIYWDNPNIDEVNELSNAIAIELFDIAVNIGPLTACKWLQRILNVLNDVNLIVDGIIGVKTINELKTYLKNRRKKEAENVMIKALNALQGNHYITIAEYRRNQRAFIYGWLRKRI